LGRRASDYYCFNSVENYTKRKEGLDAPYPTVQFFQEHSTEIFEIDCNGEDFEMFEAMRIYIEKDGRPYNYLELLDELNEKREDHLQVEEKERNVKMD